MYALGRFHNYVSAFLAELTPPPLRQRSRFFLKDSPLFEPFVSVRVTLPHALT